LVSEPVKLQGIISLGEDFELDLRAYELRRDERTLKLERIPMQVLLFLIEHRNELVTREQIVEKIWSKDVFFDTDNSINGAIRKIRQVLRDDPEQPRFIQTITGQGYRFIAAVQCEVAVPTENSANGGQTPSLLDALPARSPVASQTEIPEVPPSRPESRKKLRLVYAALATVMVAGVAGWVLWARAHQTPPTTRKVMLAVLPFQNLTGDATQEYFSDGLTEEMLTQLGNLDPQHIGVIARTSIMRYKNNQPSLESVVRELGVDYVLEGSVRRDADKVRITAQLIQTRDQTHLWAREYDRELSSLLSVQSEIAREVADEIQLTLGEKKHGEAAPQSPLSAEALQAYDLYLRGRYVWNKRTPQSFRQAADYFQQSIAKQPSYAKAYAGLADTYALMSNYGYAEPAAVMPKARTAALTALQLDDGLAEAHTSLALIVESYDWDWKTAESEYRRAIELNPNYATAHQWYAEYLGFQGRFDEALAESERARQLDPLSLIVASDRGAIFLFARQYDRAIEQFRAVIEAEPDSPRAHLILFAYAQKGQFAEALQGTQQWRRAESGPWTWAVEAYVHGRAGQQAQARQALVKMEQANRRWHLDPAPMYATAYAGMNQRDESIAWLEKAFAQHSNLIDALTVDPVYDSLRSDPRFQDLLRRVGSSNQ